ncbi:MAG TPA: hypothetical protein VES60_06760 [Nakamurella sp.]|nr:hypothetical protein [Nakamurella sp.]
MNELRAETVGGVGETPYRTTNSQTPPPLPHNISCFCGVATGVLVDAQNPGTGRDGATNKAYGLGSRVTGHRNTNESDAVFNDFLPLLDFAPLLNFVPPVPGSAQAPIEPRRNPLAHWWSRLSAWWRQRSR